MELVLLEVKNYVKEVEYYYSWKLDLEEEEVDTCSLPLRGDVDEDDVEEEEDDTIVEVAYIFDTCEENIEMPVEWEDRATLVMVRVVVEVNVKVFVLMFQMNTEEEIPMREKKVMLRDD